MTELDGLRRLEDKVDAVLNTVSEMKGSLLARVDNLQTKSDDHEARLRSLERFRYAWPSVALITAFAAVGTLAYYLFVAR